MEEKTLRKQVALALGWTIQRLNYVLDEKKHVGFDEALKIEKASEGQIKARALCKDIEKIVEHMQKAL
jgi:hypothetical protein